MSSTLPIPDASSAARTPAALLAELRSEIDRIDDAIHDLLMDRADTVARVGALRAKGPVALRPGREAQIIRRLLARNRAPLPRMAVVRLWRELLAATTAIQGRMSVAVCEADPSVAGQFAQLAREHFGALTPVRVHRSPAQAIAEVSAGHATVAILPMPADDDPGGGAWWTTLLHRDQPRIHVVARLPFWAPRPDGSAQVQALVVSVVPPDPSGLDRSMIGLEMPLDVSRGRLATALSAGGLVLGPTLYRRDQRAEVAHVLVDAEGLLRDDDPRLSNVPEALRPPVVLGAYAVPVEGEDA